MRKSILAIGLILWAATANAKLMDLSFFKLDNGLEVAVAENHKAPIALTMLYYKTGSINDPKGKGGIAHLLEHLMFRGTKKLPGQAFNRLAEEHGAQNNAYTTYQETGYYEFADVSKLELMLAMEAERMQNLTIDEAAFAKERDVVLQERRQRFETNPAPLFYEMLNKALWQDHPLANPVSGSPQEIMALTAADARGFYRRYYRPDNALLVLSGDITAREAKILAQKYFGGIPAANEPVPVAVEGGRLADTEMTVRLDGVQQPRYAQYIRLDAGAFNKTEILSLELLADYLAGDDTSFLSERLVYDNPKLLGVDISVSYDDKLGGSLAFFAVPATDVGLAAIKNMVEEAAFEGANALTEDKLQKVKNRVLSDAVYLQENPESAARFAGDLLMAGYSADEIANYDAAVQAITVDDVRKAWKKAMAGKARATGYLLGAETVQVKE